MEQFDTNKEKIKPIKLKPYVVLAIILVVLLIIAAIGSNDEATDKPTGDSFGANKDYKVEYVSNNDYRDLENVVEEFVLSYYRVDFERIHSLSPQEFEEFIAFLLHRRGYQVEITPATHDGGKDIIAKYRMPAGHTIICYVECKHFNPNRKVGVHHVRSLYGVISGEEVNYGLLITSSKFTKGAIEFQKSHTSLIGLKDINDIKEWLT